MANDAFKFSGEGAVNYDKYLGPLLFEPNALSLVAKLETANVASVLEIACGTGRVTRHLCSHFNSSVKLTASDFNADMLQVAKTRLNNDTIEFRLEDAQNLSFPDNSFDLVICQFGLMFLQDKKKGLSEAMRVLKPGGKFLFNTWDKTENIPLLKLIFNDVILPYFKDENTTRFLVPFSLHDPAMLQTWMEETHFSETKIERVTLKSQSPSPDEIVNGFFTKHSLGQEVLAKGHADFEKVAAKLEKEIIKQFGITDIRFDLSAYLVSGRKSLV